MALSAKWFEKTDWIEVPFNLRRNFVAYIQVPKNITKAEAERLTAMILHLGLPDTEGGGAMSNCSCLYYDGDYEPLEVIQARVSKSRVERKCLECGGVIAVGDRYERMFSRWDGEANDGTE